MRQRIYWLKATIYISIVIAPFCCVNAYNYELDKRLKKMAQDYGDRLSSFENDPYRVLGRAQPNKRLKSRSKLHSIISTRCTTEGSMTLDFGFTLNSSEETSNTERGTKATANTNRMVESVEGIDPKQNVYEPPPSPKSPDHYIDDP